MHAKEEIEMNEFQVEDPQELSIEQQISKKMNPQISSSESKAIIRFTVLYFVIGIPAGFYASLTLLLQGSGISSGQMAFWVTSLYPLSFKLILAPFLDSFYLSKFGKRKTYVIPSLYMLGLNWHIVGIRNRQKNLIFILCLIILLTVLQYCATIATNGWVLTSFSKYYVHFGATCQMVGLSLGFVFSYAILMNITFGYFVMNIWVQINQQYHQIHTHIGIITQYLATEDFVEEEKPNFIQVLKLSFSLLSNSNLRFLLLFLLTRRFAFTPVIASTSFKWDSLNLNMHLQKLYALHLGYQVLYWLLNTYKEMTWVLNAYYLMFLVMATHFLYVISFIKTGGYNKFLCMLYNIIQFVLQYIYEFNNSFISCTLSAFFLRIADPTIGATYATLLFGCYLFGTQFSASVS
ncbi:unnamed protein product [Paramecium octaurelia]|uniref:Transmembrane protein n=1 Tax=Paramecium octaurelia TaxID=43137 RepID=A0A8S1V7K3_PAROT|nr:unnamed protein product [Paramecium octaurelia]